MSDFISFQPVSMHRNILCSLAPVQMGKTVILVDNTAHRIRGKHGLADIKGWINGFVHDCWVTAKIRSLPEVKLPLFGNEDTPTDQLNKTLLYEWGTDRLELEILLGDGLGNWGSFGETAIKNSNGYRYRKHRALDLMTDQSGFQLEENFKIGARLINVGFGDLTRADKVDILGSWTQEFVTIQPQPVYVTNNVYGGTGTAPTTPVSNAVLSLTLSSGTSALIGSGTPINIALTKATASKSFTATWRREGTLTTLSGTLTTDANGNASLTYDSSNFSVLGGGKYSLEITDNGKSVLSNEITAVMPSVVVSPVSVYNWSASTVSVAVTGLAVGTTYTLGFVGITATNISRTQSADTTTFTFPGNTFSNPGTYKARLTKNNIVVESNDLVINAAPVFTLSTPRNNIAFFSEDTQITFRCTNLQRSSALTFFWFKNNVQIGTTPGNSTTDAEGVWTSSFGCTALQGTPFNGEGSYKIKVMQGTTEVMSNSIEARAFRFNRQPLQGEVIYRDRELSFDFQGVPVGATFTHVLLKAGVAVAAPINATFAYLDSAQLYHRVIYNSTTVFNSYGGSNSYSLRITYNGIVLNSNTFSLNNVDQSGGALG